MVDRPARPGAVAQGGRPAVAGAVRAVCGTAAPPLVPADCDDFVPDNLEFPLRTETVTGGMSCRM